MAGQPLSRARKKLAKERRVEREANGGKRKVHSPTPPEKKAAKKKAAEEAIAQGETDLFAGYPEAAWKEFIQEYLNTGRQDKACAKSGIPRQTVYRRTRQDAEFALIMEEAREICMSSLEDAALRRGRDGWLEPQYGREGFMGNVRKYSDQLLMFMLTNGKPEKYRPKKDVDLNINPASQPPIINLTLTRKGDDNG